ncbi:MAG: hypothetical protein V4508_14825 [Pseudomonadota bacterium]
MTTSARPLGALALITSLLSACGGGSATPEVRLTQGIAVGEPSPSAPVPVVADFIRVARQASCSDISNRMVMIDQKLVYWDTAGNCADASYARQLLGATPQTVLCSMSDTIAGPRTACSDAQYRSMFDTILSKRDKADLGLGSAHRVEPIPFLPASGSALKFSTVVNDAFSGVLKAQVAVVSDDAAWAALWAQHSATRSPAPALPKIDFSRQMLLGVFSGQHPNGCHELSINRIVVDGERLVVEYVDRDVAPLAVCIAALTANAYIVAIDRVDAKVDFVAQLTPGK